ncbi:unnamed protein product, partial [Prorocentrum cordatum]
VDTCVSDMSMINVHIVHAACRARAWGWGQDAVPDLEPELGGLERVPRQTAPLEPAPSPVETVHQTINSPHSDTTKPPLSPRAAPCAAEPGFARAAQPAAAAGPRSCQLLVGQVRALSPASVTRTRRATVPVPAVVPAGSPSTQSTSMGGAGCYMSASLPGGLPAAGATRPPLQGSASPGWDASRRTPRPPQAPLHLAAAPLLRSAPCAQASAGERERYLSEIRALREENRSLMQLRVSTPQQSQPPVAPVSGPPVPAARGPAGAPSQAVHRYHSYPTINPPTVAGLAAAPQCAGTASVPRPVGVHGMAVGGVTAASVPTPGPQKVFVRF